MNRENSQPDNARSFKYTPTLIILLLIVSIVVVLIAKYNKAPEPLPPVTTDTSHTRRIPPDSLPH